MRTIRTGKQWGTICIVESSLKRFGIIGEGVAGDGIVRRLVRYPLNIVVLLLSIWNVYMIAYAISWTTDFSWWTTLTWILWVYQLIHGEMTAIDGPLFIELAASAHESHEMPVSTRPTLCIEVRGLWFWGILFMVPSTLTFWCFGPIAAISQASMVIATFLAGLGNSRVVPVED